MPEQQFASVFAFLANWLGDPKTRNGGMTERRNGGKLPQILKRGMAENHPKS